MASTCVLSLPKKCYMTIDLPPVSADKHAIRQLVDDTLDRMNKSDDIRNVCIYFGKDELTAARLPRDTWKVVLQFFQATSCDRIVIPFKSNDTEDEVKIVREGWYSNAIGASFDYTSLARVVGVVL